MIKVLICQKSCQSNNQITRIQYNHCRCAVCKHDNKEWILAGDCKVLLLDEPVLYSTISTIGARVNCIKITLPT